jgi:hypothetical protein
MYRLVSSLPVRAVRVEARIICIFRLSGRTIFDRSQLISLYKLCGVKWIIANYEMGMQYNDHPWFI